MRPDPGSYFRSVPRGSSALRTLVGVVALPIAVLMFAPAAANAAADPTPIASPTLIDVEREYVAAYSRADQGIALTLAAFFGALTAFFVWRSTRLEGSVLSALLFCGTISYAIEMIATRVRFTRQGFVARLSWFRHLQEPYERVERISGKPGTLTIHFSDGQLLKLHSGLGDADTVIAYLQAHCPESVRIE